jgi:hypothetical protein
MAVEGTEYYNYYNIAGRFTPETAQAPAWKKKYSVTTDEVKSSNYSQEEDAYKAYSALEDIYYAASVQNREKYSDVNDLYAHLSEKYLFNKDYSDCSYSEKQAMYFNELNMTLYGCLSNGGNLNDPRLKGEVEDLTDSGKQSYNRQMVNTQIWNIFKNNGIDMSALKNRGLIFTIDPFNYILKVSGTEDESISEKMEAALNSGNNARQLFYHILNSSSSSISQDVLTKYQALKDFQNVTELDLRDFFSTEEGFVNSDGVKALDIYKESLKSSDTIPSEFKSDAYSYFSALLQKLSETDFSEIPDLNLTIGFDSNGLYDISDKIIHVASFNQLA